MDFDLSKAQKLLKDSARQFFSRECRPERVRQLMETATAFDAALWAGIADNGWTGLIVPEDQGGLGGSLVDLAAVAEEMGRACLPGPFLSTVFATALIRAAGTAEQQARYLPPIAAGELKATVALLEEPASWDLRTLRVRAVRERDSFVFSGRKLFVPDAAVADLLLCVARASDKLVVLPVRRDAAGVAIEAMPSMDATRKHYGVAFDNVAIPAGDALGSGADERAAIAAAIDFATVVLCAEIVGGMQWVLETAVEYAKTRQQFGRPIGSFQAVQHHCADMLLLTESARSATYYAAWATSENDPAATLAVAIAKAYCSDACREAGNRGIQVHGGIGFSWEHDIHLYYKRAKASEVLFGDATFHRERIARLVVDEAGAAGVPAAEIPQAAVAT